MARRRKRKKWTDLIEFIYRTVCMLCEKPGLDFIAFIQTGCRGDRGRGGRGGGGREMEEEENIDDNGTNVNF